jgi:hypothetical protein
MKRRLAVLFIFLTVTGVLLSVHCNLQTPGNDISEQDLFGKWVMSSAAMKYTETTHTSVTNRDSVFTNDTIVHFTDGSNYYRFYNNMTYRTQFEGAIIGYNGVFSDTGTWALRGGALRTTSMQLPDPVTSAVSLDGDSATIVSRMRSDAQGGTNAGDSIFYHWDITFSAVKQ